MQEKIKEKVGFIGLGLMGMPMARNLLQADVDLSVYNRSASKAAQLSDEGARAFQSPEDLAADVEQGILIICVADTTALSDVIKGANGLLQADLDGMIIIDMGTSKVPITQELASLVAHKGAAYIDAPVSGGEVGAQEATLSIMAGGDAATIERARSVFDILGQSLTHMGPVGSGQIAKAANQMIVGATMTIVAEAILLAQRAGADTAAMRQALLGGFAASRILDLHGERMINQNFEPGGRAWTQAKDLTQTAEFASELGLSLPLFSANEAMWREMVENGLGDLDQSGFLRFLERQNAD